MFDPNLQRRIAENCTTAAFGYARAAGAAYSMMAQQALDFWSAAADPDKRRSAPSFSVLTPFDFMPPSTTGRWLEMTPWRKSPAELATQLAFNPVTAWWGLFPLQGNPATWPMAYAMMSAGWPRDVAMPAAEANLAAMDAMKAAGEQFDEVFASYRSESGYAVAQIVSTRKLLTAAFVAPIGANGTWPWSATFPG